MWPCTNGALANISISMADSEGAAPGGRKPRPGTAGGGGTVTSTSPRRSVAHHLAFPSEIADVVPQAPFDTPRASRPRAMSDPATRFEPGKIVSGRYEIKSLIASGGMGRVYLATQIALNRSVAIKILLPHEADPAFRKRFLLEASVSAQLTHRHIVTVHDYGETEDGDLYLAMEYLDGMPLSKAITQALRMAPLRACRIAMQMCRALRAAHARGVVHRDLKPRNVMLLIDEDDDDNDDGGGDFVKVLDFGLVKVFEAGEQGPGFADFTRVGTLLGSPKYMSPEQIRSQPVGPWSDVYALGAIMFHMLAGRPPFVGSTSPEVLSQQVNKPAPSIQSVIDEGTVVPPELEVIVQKTLEKSVERRYASMDELLADLRAASRLIAGAGQHASSVFFGGTSDGLVDDFVAAFAPPVFALDVGREDNDGRPWGEGARTEAPIVDLSQATDPSVTLLRRGPTLVLTWHFWLLAVLVILTAVLAGLLLGRVS